jgi:hypothetical protein
MQAIGTRSYSDPLTFRKVPLDKAESTRASHRSPLLLEMEVVPRLSSAFPACCALDGVEHFRASRRLQVWSANEVADDWLKIGPGQVYWRALQHIEANHRGILLLHDIQPKTCRRCLTCCGS